MTTTAAAPPGPTVAVVLEQPEYVLTLTDWKHATWGPAALAAALSAHLPGARVRAAVDEDTEHITLTVRGASLPDVDAAADLYLASAGITYRLDTTGEAP